MDCFATTTGTPHETDDSNFWTLRGVDEHLTDEYPVHEVTISKPFYMGIYELTQAVRSKNSDGGFGL